MAQRGSREASIAGRTSGVATLTVARPHLPRPRVTININAPNEASDQDLLTLDLPPGLTVKDLKGYLEAETSFPAATQTFYLNGRALSSEVQTLEQAGIKDGEMLAVLIRQGQPQRQNPSANRNTDMGVTPSRPQRPDPEMVRLHTLNDPAAQASLRQSSPTLFAALQDPSRWREEFDKMQRQQDEAELERQRQIALLNEDPFNVDAQRKIEEMIRHDRVIENLQHAYENNPEGKSYTTS
ncbi:hypothetical protein K491DRAFT_721955 [Lophiostoma macrostomum CBS 122681]|uniref:Ubiquitin-like domain-containing protein n=1 Tax=Lophiostoma macrostomum CBS 122681 TaxID=1314788 RepID=A0A6A6SQ56_9PLEO|nr:hypothetical protein K491DRAFT_721955 [Lophiostoma macrostomum CBS 122681]